MMNTVYFYIFSCVLEEYCLHFFFFCIFIYFQVYLKKALSIFMRTPGCPLHPSKNLYLNKQILCEFERFFKRGIFETPKHSTS